MNEGVIIQYNTGVHYHRLCIEAIHILWEVRRHVEWIKALIKRSSKKRHKSKYNPWEVVAKIVKRIKFIETLNNELVLRKKELEKYLK